MPRIPKQTWIGLLLFAAFAATLRADSPDSNAASSMPSQVLGVRGLEEEGGPVDTTARDFAAVDHLDQLVITDDQLERFMNEGKLK